MRPEVDERCVPLPSCQNDSCSHPRAHQQIARGCRRSTCHRRECSHLSQPLVHAQFGDRSSRRRSTRATVLCPRLDGSCTLLRPAIVCLPKLTHFLQNMAGKSTFLRQTALIAVLAQAGSYVPAESVRMGVFDRVFSRVGARDELDRDRSTFMIEMDECTSILENATSRSLVSSSTTFTSLRSADSALLEGPPRRARSRHLSHRRSCHRLRRARAPHTRQPLTHALRDALPPPGCAARV